MTTLNATAVDYQLNWRKLQQVGLNAYEARSYLVLLGHPRFKALELAARAHVPTICVLTGGFSADELRRAGAVAVYESIEALLGGLDETPFR